MRIIAILLALTLHAANISEEKLRKAQNDPATWLTYGKNYASSAESVG